MNILCTLYISNKKLGTIISIPKNIESVSTIKQDLSSKVVSPITDTISSVRFSSPNSILVLTDEGSGPRLDLQSLEEKVVDTPLRKLSSNEYIVTTDKAVMHKDKMYKFFGNLPTICQWKAIPFVKTAEIIDYKSTGEIDDLFLKEGYAKELKEASHILVPPEWEDLSQTCTPYDLLIKKVDGLSNRSNSDGVVFHSFSERKGEIPEPYEINGRYILLTSTPRFEGTYKNPPFTYNIDTLVFKCGVLQDRLQAYGATKVESVCASMRSLGQRLKDVNNQFQACSVYDDVVTILEKAKNMD